MKHAKEQRGALDNFIYKQPVVSNVAAAPLEPETELEADELEITPTQLCQLCLNFQKLLEVHCIFWMT